MSPRAAKHIIILTLKEQGLNNHEVGRRAGCNEYTGRNVLKRWGGRAAMGPVDLPVDKPRCGRPRKLKSRCVYCDIYNGVGMKFVFVSDIKGRL